jgi:hypothetical protein
LEVAFAGLSSVAGYDSSYCWHYVFAGNPAAAAFLAGTSFPAFASVLAVVGVSAPSVPFVGILAVLTTDIQT